MNILSVFGELLAQSGFAALTWQQAVMLLISFILLYLAIKKQFEPLLLLPIAFGMFLANLPLAGLMNEADNWYNSGVLRIIYSGVKSSLFPCLIFMAVGAMTDFRGSHPAVGPAAGRRCIRPGRRRAPPEVPVLWQRPSCFLLCEV